MNKLEMLNEIKKCKLESAKILDLIATEKRSATEVETVNLESLKDQLAEYQTSISEIKTENRNLIVGENRVEKFSLLTSIRNYVEGNKFNDETLKIIAAGQKEMVDAGVSYRGQIQLPIETRGIVNATTNTDGEYAIAEQKMDLVGPLRNALVVVRAGATVMTGLKGTVSIPKYAGSTSAWKAENAPAVDGKGAFSEVLLSAHRITSILDISKLFLNQDSTGAEALLMSDLNASVYGLLESTILSAGAHGDAPAGMLDGVSTYTSTGATTFAKVVALESLVNTANALTNKIAYVTTPAIRGIGKTTAKASNGGTFVVEGDTANGYPIYSTSAMAAGKVIFGNWAELFIGNWGSLDITVDPYTQAHLGVVRLVVNSYWDFAKRRPEAFAYANLT